MQHAHLAKTLLAESRGDMYNVVISQLESYVACGQLEDDVGTVKFIHPLVVYGEEGSGCSTACAHIAHSYCSIPGWTDAVCIYRFAGLGVHCRTLEQVLRSVTQHICLLFDLDSKQIYQVRDILSPY